MFSLYFFLESSSKDQLKDILQYYFKAQKEHYRVLQNISSCSSNNRG